VVVEGDLHEPKVRPHFDGRPFVNGAHIIWKTVLATLRNMCHDSLGEHVCPSNLCVEHSEHPIIDPGDVRCSDKM
jgi:hypothetical protein